MRPLNTPLLLIIVFRLIENNLFLVVKDKLQYKLTL